MKKTFCFVLAVVLSGFLLMAEEGKSPAACGFKVFPGLALDFAGFRPSLLGDDSQKIRFMFQGGIGYEIELAKDFLIELDVMFKPTGYIINQVMGGVTTKITSRGFAISAPLFLKYKFMPGNAPYLLAGGELGYILSQKSDYEVGGTKLTVDNLNDTRRLYGGLVFGIGTQVGISQKMSLVVEARYQLGLTNAIKNPMSNEYIHFNSILVLLGLRF